MTDREQDRDDPERVDRLVTRDARRPAVTTAKELAVAMVGLDARPATVLELAGGAGTRAWLAHLRTTWSAPVPRTAWSRQN